MTLSRREVEGEGLFSRVDGQKVSVHPIFIQHIVPNSPVGIAINGMLQPDDGGPLVNEPPGEIGEGRCLLKGEDCQFLEEVDFVH